MIPNEAKNQFQEIITNEMFEMDRALGGVMAATQSNASSRGAGTSGPAMQALTQDATNSLKARAQFILGQLLRCLAVHHVVMTPDTLAEASTLLRDAIQTQAQLVRGRLFGNGVSVFKVWQQRDNSSRRNMIRRDRDWLVGSRRN